MTKMAIEFVVDVYSVSMTSSTIIVEDPSISAFSIYLLFFCVNFLSTIGLGVLQKILFSDVSTKRLSNKIRVYWLLLGVDET